MKEIESKNQEMNLDDNYMEKIPFNNYQSNINISSTDKSISNDILYFTISQDSK